MKLKAFIIISFVLFFSCKKEEANVPVKLEGKAFGTTFHIIYFDEKQQDFTKEIDSLFNAINKSLSTYITDSDISKINKSDSTILVDDYFIEVYEKSKRIYKETNGIFDPTIGVLVNAWGFGPVKADKNPDSAKVKELLQLVGFGKVLLQNRKISKISDSVYFDFNAIAKGYAVDIAGRFLEDQSIENYIVEIGGEIRTKGKNITKNSAWTVGIEDPHFDGTRSFNKVIELTDEAIATSGNYRKFKTDSITGNRYVHILSTKTGYPTVSNLLSVSVIGKMDCADVDGYATAIMAMTLDEATAFFESHKELKGFIIYNDENNELKTFATSNF